MRPSLLTKQCAASTQPEGSIPVRMSLMRFPYGCCDTKSLGAAADAGLLAIQWDLVTGDPDPHRSARAIADTILTKVHPGAIIVAHANGRGWHTADALALGIPKLKKEGYSFVTVSELLKAGKPVDYGELLLEQARRQYAHRSRCQTRRRTRCPLNFRIPLLILAAPVLWRSILAAQTNSLPPLWRYRPGQ